MSKSVVLITGALTGIGRATALAFAHEGADVVVSGRRDDAGEALVSELRGLGAEAEFIRADVRHEGDVQNLVDKTVARFGRLDIAVSNAGTEGRPGPVTEQSADSYAATFDTNVLGVLLSMKHELRVMQAQGFGSIVNLSSTMGQRGAPGASLYTASKHAVRPDQVGGARRRGVRGPRQRGRARPDRDRDAGPLYRQCRPQGRHGRGHSAATRRAAAGDRRRHRVRRLCKSVVHHRPDHQRQWRQDRLVNLSPHLDQLPQIQTGERP